MNKLSNESTKARTRQIFDKYFHPDLKINNNLESRASMDLSQIEMIEHYMPDMDKLTKERAMKTLSILKERLSIARYEAIFGVQK